MNWIKVQIWWPNDPWKVINLLVFYKVLLQNECKLLREQERSISQSFQQGKHVYKLQPIPKENKMTNDEVFSYTNIDIENESFNNHWKLEQLYVTLVTLNML